MICRRNLQSCLTSVHPVFFHKWIPWKSTETGSTCLCANKPAPDFGLCQSVLLVKLPWRAAVQPIMSDFERAYMGCIAENNSWEKYHWLSFPLVTGCVDESTGSGVAGSVQWGYHSIYTTQFTASLLCHSCQSPMCKPVLITSEPMLWPMISWTSC